MLDKEIDILAVRGISFENGHTRLHFIDDDGEKRMLDLTAEIERIVDAKVQEHRQQLHGHQL